MAEEVKRDRLPPTTEEIEVGELRSGTHYRPPLPLLESCLFSSIAALPLEIIANLIRRHEDADPGALLCLQGDVEIAGGSGGVNRIVHLHAARREMG